MISREKYIAKLLSYKDKDIIKIITGLRRSGKSVVLFDLFYDALIKNGVKKHNIIKINLENSECENLRDKNNLYNHIISNTPKLNKTYVFIDEIQYVNGFEDVVNSLKNKGLDVYITGSNSKLLSKEIATSLRGRGIEIKIFPISFDEMYTYNKQINTSTNVYELFKEYMLYGGLPYVVAEPNTNLKIEYLKMILDTIAFKDIIDRYALRHPDMFEGVFNFLNSNIGSITSSKKISDTLKSNSFKTITTDTVSKYLSYLEESYLFYKVYRYDLKGKEYLKTLNKYYVSDIGIRNAKLNFRQIEPTHTLENIIYIELLRRGYIVDIGKNNNKEIDFVATNTKDRYYIQVAYTMIDEEKAKQELSSYKNLDDGYKKIVLTMDNIPFTNLESGYKMYNVIDFLTNRISIE